MTLAFTRFDLMSWFAQRQMLLALALIVVVGIIIPVPGMAIVASAFVTSMMLSTPFLGDERDRLDTLYGVLPVSRRAIVVGRALSILLYGVVALIVATLATLGVAAVRGTMIAPELLAIAYAAAFAIVGLSIGVQLPVLFRVGYSRGRLMVYAPTILIVGAAWIAQAAGVIDGDVLGSIPFALGLGICAAIGVLGIVVGTLIAVRLYSTRELR
ncbi:ABC-2 transporter permease [Microbacterium sp. dk485]|uniref:ABC-2 transporter permease n=1 Tax=Microbacterium sp. dk485 TaxID=2560021 RepID=UPI001073F2A1|nr:ABC-2 transporter permease [Microbacterium sp. dk485]TFV84472.1 ABC-2 transporter permease [Microbacterium sp. dk485]